MYICKRVRSKFELSLIRLWYTLAHQYNLNQWQYRDFNGHLVNDWAQVQFQKIKLQIKNRKKKIDLKSGLCSTLLNCLMILCFGLQPFFFLLHLQNANLPLIWIQLLKPTMRFSFIFTHLRQWDHAGLLKRVGCGGEWWRDSYRWKEAGGERRWRLEITLVKPATGHTHL